MTIPFAEAATTEPAFTYDYEQHLTSIKAALPGFEKAQLFLSLIRQIDADQLAFGDIAAIVKKFPLIEQAILESETLAIMCQDPVTSVYFCPAEGGEGICIADSLQSSMDSWHGLKVWVSMNDVNRLLVQITPQVPSAPV